MIYRARCILPIGEAPIDNGAIRSKDGRIEWLGRWRDCATEGESVRDLGEVAILPGLINGHCHLDYTSMAGKIPPPASFPDWIKTILSFKAHWSFSDFAESWLKGARMLVASGVTTVADIESAPELLPEVWPATPLRVISFIEMTGVKDQRKADEVIGETLEYLEKAPKSAGKECALSPHSLYSTTPDLIQKSATLARERSWRLTTHLAESESEFEMFTSAAGPFYDWLKTQRNMSDCGHGSPIQRAHEYGLLGPDFLAVHVNYLAPGDAELLGRSRSSVVHCPRSHDYFRHKRFPLEELQSSGVNICLGTDSLASSRKSGGKDPELNLWDEMRRFAETHAVRPSKIFEMVTTRAARALGKGDEIGQLIGGLQCDLVTSTYAGPLNPSALYENLLFNTCIREVVIGGEIVAKA